RHGRAPPNQEPALAAPRPRLHRGGAPTALSAAARSGPVGDPVRALPSWRALRRQRPAARARGVGGAGACVHRRAPCAEAEARGVGLSGARSAAASRRAPRPRHQHIRKGDQARLGVARLGTFLAGPDRRADRGAGAPEPATGRATLSVAPAEAAPDAAADAGPIKERATPVPGVAEPAAPSSPEVAAPTAGGTRKPARYGLSIQFEPQPGDPELARLVETTVWINEAHPAYRRATASRSEGYHIALATAMALAPLAVEPAKEHAFLTTFLAAWGAALDRRGARRRK